MKIKFFIIYFVIGLMGILSIKGCKTTEESEVYDIRGKWFLIAWNPGSDATNGFAMEITFSGSETEGTAAGIFFLHIVTGTYSFNNNQVTITMSLFNIVTTFSGTFTDPDHITGTWEGKSDTGLFDLRR